MKNRRTGVVYNSRKLYREIESIMYDLPKDSFDNICAVAKKCINVFDESIENQWLHPSRAQSELLLRFLRIMRMDVDYFRRKMHDSRIESIPFFGTRFGFDISMREAGSVREALDYYIQEAETRLIGLNKLRTDVENNIDLEVLPCSHYSASCFLGGKMVIEQPAQSPRYDIFSFHASRMPRQLNMSFSPMPGEGTDSIEEAKSKFLNPLAEEAFVIARNSGGRMNLEATVLPVISHKYGSHVNNWLEIASQNH